MYANDKKSDMQANDNASATDDQLESEQDNANKGTSTREVALSPGSKSALTLATDGASGREESSSPPVVLDEVYATTIVNQLAGTVPQSPGDSAASQALIDDAVAAYKLMNPADPIDSVLCRFVVAIGNAGMDSLSQATAATGLSLTKERELKLGMKAAMTTVELIKAFDGRRVHGQQRLNVSQVTVQSGGQAVIGNIKHSKTDSAASASSKDCDDDEAA